MVYLTTNEMDYIFGMVTEHWLGNRKVQDRVLVKIDKHINKGSTNINLTKNEKKLIREVIKADDWECSKKHGISKIKLLSKLK